MDSVKLRKLSRTEIQSIAKIEHVRAVGKTEDIIRRLLSKHPEGVPISKDINDTPSPTPEKEKLTKKGTKSKLKATRSIEGRRRGRTTPGVGESTEGKERNPIPVAGEAVAGPSKRELPNSQDQARHDDAKIDISCLRVEKVPNEYMVVDALRAFTTLVNDAPGMKQSVRETKELLDHTAGLIEEMMPEIRETSLVREKLGALLLAKMKKKPELWDGTARMEKRDRKLRVEWLRSERKAESIKKWEEENKEFARSGHSPEPYENYA
ncbi:hypothetical protein EDD16DRAFT_1710061 [Pisolithus croceorrhizus]|nr:hypothetical protein EDD16DRAFT_1710061 [Pisolithus croceorrhizus]KAI6125491.1 hypothetical protein EV401DRAFT_2068241 [Pisolithus croceorrhizus]